MKPRCLKRRAREDGTARKLASFGARAGADAGARTGPFGAGLGAGLGGALGYLTGAAVDDLKRTLTPDLRPDGGEVIEERPRHDDRRRKQSRDRSRERDRSPERATRSGRGETGVAISVTEATAEHES